MATEKILNTRLQLKYDSYANWTNATLGDNKGANFVLKAGEIGICYLPTNSSDGQVTGSQPPQILIKVGDGTSKFSALPWASAKAADVYAWAKQANLPVERADSDLKDAEGKDKPEGNVISGISWENGKIIYTTASVATSEGMAELQKTINDNKDIWAQDTIFYFTEFKDDEERVVGISITTQEDGTSGQTIRFDFVTEDQLATALNNYYTKQVIDDYYYTGQKVDELIPEISGANAISAIIKGPIENNGPRTTAEISLKLDSTGNVSLTQSEDGLKADIDLSAYRKVDEDENTAHTHIAGTGIKLENNNNGGIDGEVKLGLNIAMELAEKTIKIFDKDDDTKAAIATLDATSFIKDGMIESVELVQQDDKGTEGQFLKITWNIDDANGTDEGDAKDVVYINVGDLVDVYTGSTNEDITVAVDAQNVISATLNKEFAEKSELSGYKTKQQEYQADGSTVKTITRVDQNENGEVTVTYGDIAFPALPVVNDGKFTVSGTGALTGSGEMTANQAGDTTATLDVVNKGITTAKLADGAVGAAQTKAAQSYTGEDAEVWVFYCGDSTTLV